MRDDQRSDNLSDREDRRDAFDDALYDLFGFDEPDDAPPSEPEPAPSPPPATEFNQQPFPAEDLQTPSPNLVAPPPAEGGQRRNWRKIGCITCLGFAGLIFTCLFILFVIGLVAGDPADATPTSRIWFDLAAIQGVAA